MTAVTYTAKRSMIAGHTLGVVYKLPLTCQDIVAGREKREAMNQSLAGVRETFLYFTKKTFQVTLAPLQLGALDLMLEFLDSVSGGETFTFDPYGQVDFAVAPITAYLTSEPYGVTPFSRQHRGGQDDFHVVSFSVREK